MKNINIRFEVSGTVNQEILLYPNAQLTEEEFLAKLKNGEVLTTLGHGTGEASPVYLTKDLSEPIGIVVHQVVESDMEFDSFEVFNSDD